MGSDRSTSARERQNADTNRARPHMASVDRQKERLARHPASQRAVTAEELGSDFGHVRVRRSATQLRQQSDRQGDGALAPATAKPGRLESERGNSGGAEGAVIGGLIGGILGAAAGFAVGGPIGAVVGGVAGAGLGAAAGAGIAGAAGQPGNARSVDLQPVVFRSGAADPAPTGGSWSRRLGPSNRIWGKLGVTYSDSTPVVIDNATLKSAGGTRAERDAIRATHSNASKVCVFLTDNDLADAGGGGTVGGGAAGAKIALSDRGTSNTLLAHELGHVLGLGHPPTGADDNTVMTPSGSINVDNPTRNTIGNYNRITWPAPGGPVTIHPDT